jgi:HAE1 family hydrophobic/amphiphilic exporter-1
VVVGGLSLSAILTLLIIPPMLTMLVGPLETRRLARAAEADDGPQPGTVQPEPAAGE